MQLPKIAQQEYSLELPLSKKKIKFRPFRVAEEKVLLTALEGYQGNDTSEITDAVLSVTQACITTKGIEADTLPSVDVEFLFLNMRKKSIGEIVEVLAPCDKCHEHNKVKFNLNNTVLVVPEGHSSKIFLTDTVGVVMKHPTLDFSLGVLSKSNKIEVMFDIIIDSIETIFDGENFEKAENFKKDDLKTWVETFDPQSFRKLYAFFETMPHLQTKQKYKCTKCNEENELEVNGSADFFG